MANDFQKPTSAIAPADALETPDLPLLRFGLRQLLVFVTLLSLLMAAMAVSQGRFAVVLLLAALVVALHVFGTALGTQLRARANRTQSRDAIGRFGDDSAPAGVSAENAPPFHERHRSPWHQRRGTPLPWLVRFIATAAGIGAVLGGVCLQVAVGHRASPAGVAVGAVSLAVVAGWFAFLSYSFYGVFRHGLRDALAHEHRNQSR